MKKIKIALALSISVAMATAITTPAFASTLQTESSGDSINSGYTEIVSLGANLTYTQKEEMLKDFDVSATNSGNVKIIETTNEDIVEALGYPADTPIPASSQSISSCKIVLEPEGSGINVSTTNLTEVTGNMLASALETCGITNATITADAPYPVTGQAALAGIIQGFQDATNKTVPEANKKVANNEINTTTALGKQLGTQKAEKIVTETKTQVIKDNPTTTEQITNIINNVTNNNNVTLTAAQEKELVNLMQQIKSLNLNYSKLKNALNEINDNIDAGKSDFNNAVAKLEKNGFFGKIQDWFGEAWHEIYIFFGGGTQSSETQTTSGGE